MKCPQCGKEIMKGKRFCSFCDYEVTTADYHSKSKKGRKAPSAGTSAYDHSYSYDDYGTSSGKSYGVSHRKTRGSSGVGPLIIVILVALLIVGGIVFALGHFLHWFDGGNPAPQPTATAAPVVTASPTQHAVSTPRPTQAPTPTPTRAPTPTPRPTQALPEGMVLFTGSTLEDLGRTILEMQDRGQSTIRLENAPFTEDELRDLMHGLAIDAWSLSASINQMTITIEWYPGVRIWHAVQNGDEASLDSRDQRILQEARSVLNAIIRPGMTDLEKEIVIHDYIVLNCEYRIDVAGKRTDCVYGFFEHGVCQCSGYSDTFFLLGSLAGLDVVQQSGEIVESGEAHAWNLILLDNQWYLVDACWDDPVGNESDEVRWKYLNVPLDVIAVERRWDPRGLPEGRYAQTLDEKWYYYDVPLVSNTQQAIEALKLQLERGDSAMVRLTNPQDFNETQAKEGVGHRSGKNRWWQFDDTAPWVYFFSVWYE